MKVYSDSDWAGDTGSVSTHRRSRSKTHVTLYGETIDWKSKLQLIISLSSTEAEYYAAIQSSKCALHLRVLLYEIQNGRMKNADHELSLPPLQLWMDNQSTIAQIGSSDIREANADHELVLPPLQVYMDNQSAIAQIGSSDVEGYSIVTHPGEILLVERYSIVGIFEI